jgi:nitrogen fixation-related uncharacterized protein
MNYYPFWVALILVSLCASVGGFSWAYRNRQFQDQERARYLPLRDESHGRPATVRAPRFAYEGIVLVAVVGLAIAGLLATAAVVIMGKGGGQ